jgi:hypothetical protein
METPLSRWEKPVSRWYTCIRLAKLKAVSFDLLHNISTLNQCRNSVSQLCVNTLPATNTALITNGILFGSLRVEWLAYNRSRECLTRGTNRVFKSDIHFRQ